MQPQMRPVPQRASRAADHACGSRGRKTPRRQRTARRRRRCCSQYWRRSGRSARTTWCRPCDRVGGQSFSAAKTYPSLGACMLQVGARAHGQMRQSCPPFQRVLGLGVLSLPHAAQTATLSQELVVFRQKMFKFNHASGLVRFPQPCQRHCCLCRRDECCTHNPIITTTKTRSLLHML